MSLVIFNPVIAYKSSRKDKFVSKGFSSLIRQKFNYSDKMIVYRDGYEDMLLLKNFLLLVDLPSPSEEAVFRIINKISTG